MSTVSPSEAFSLAEVRRSGVAAARLVKSGSVAMAAGTAGLLGGIALHMVESALAAGPEFLAQLGRLESPLIAIGQVLLVGGAIVRRLARRRQDREGCRPGEGEDQVHPPH